ncbi:fibronectin type III domain-containing protein [Umezawaea sp.]|uniref:fibronectin type III domain-containing protein n=1 Tax=Umezawaea sp. TaxID=1955258 RepID=UPI002ED23D58
MTQPRYRRRPGEHGVRAVSLILAVALVGVGLAGSASARTEPGGDPIRVMVVGDSMSHGAEGDWTWRYRLWQWFRDQGVAVDFVGPYRGTQDAAVAAPPAVPPLQGDEPAPPGGPRTSGAYAAGAEAFDSDHFAVWGRQAAQDKGLIREQVALHQPDYVLVGLGFNDLGWFVSGPEGTLDSMRTLVEQARAAKPDVRFALANVPQRTRMDGREDLPRNTDAYNAMLAAAIPSWSTPTSPVALVDWRGNYACELDGCPDGYDGLHPNATGEYKIAQAFERTLHDGYGLGSAVPAVPTDVPARPTPVPTGVVASASPGGITVTWDAVFGAYGYTVRSRLKGAADWAGSRAAANRHDTAWTVDGQEWEYQVRTDNGDQVRSDWSPVVSAVAHPLTARGPSDIVTRATATGVDVSWNEPTGEHTSTIDRYQILTLDKDVPGAWLGGTAVKGRSVHVDGLVPGHRYTVAVATWNAAGGGIPAGARPVVVGAGTPAPPTDLRVTSTDPTTVRLRWTGSSGAAGYRVWVRDVNGGEPARVDGNVVEATEHGIAYLFPGVWNYEFCVTAINGEAESGRSDCVVAPRPWGR